MRFVIRQKSRGGLAVGGLDNDWMLVFYTAGPGAKKFPTREDAEAWGEHHSNRGYGFDMDQHEIVEVAH